MSFNQMGFVGQPPSTRAAISNQNPGQVFNFTASGGVVGLGLAPAQSAIVPEGQWISLAGPYSDLQVFDQNQQRWIGYTALDSAPLPISSDGTNYRFINSSGCPVGAVVTAGGTSLGASAPVQMYTPTGVWQGGSFTAQAAPSLTATANQGGATFNTFIGGNISTTITITSGGTLYTTAPKILILPPANQGNQPFIPATAICTISGGVINAVTVTNQGAGYVGVPQVIVLNQPGDTTGSGAVLTAAATTTTTGVGQVTAVVINSCGTAAQTSVTTVTLAGSGCPASATAICIMNFSLTSTAGSGVTAGSGYTNGYTLVPIGGTNTSTASYVNPAIEKGITSITPPIIWSASTSVAAVNNAQNNFVFGGTGFQAVPGLQAVGLASTGFITTPGVGGQNDTCQLYPI